MNATAQGVDRIISLANQCISLFTDLLSLLSGRPGDLHNVIQDYQRRFITWVELLNIFKEPRSSLSGRLGQVPSLPQVILRLLEALELNLGRVFDLESANQVPQKVPLESWLRTTFQPFHLLKPATRVASAQSSMTKACLHVIGDAIERLGDLLSVIPAHSAKVTEPSFKDDASTAGTDGNDSQDRHLKLILSGLLRSRYPKITEPLAKRLECSIIERRQRLLRSSRRQQNLDFQRWTESSSGLQSSDTPVHQTEFLFRASGKSDVETSDLRSSAPDSDTSSTTGNISYSINAPDEGGEDDRRCNWYFDHIEGAKFKDPKWRHILADIEPYVCLSDECRDYIHSFTSFRNWRSHMENVHTLGWAQNIQRRNTWYCTIDHSGHREFATPADLEEHVKNIHGDAVPSWLLASMLKQNIVVWRGHQHLCPLCYDSIPRQYMQKPRMESDPSRTKHHSANESGPPDSVDEHSSKSAQGTQVHPGFVVAKHVAEHLKSLALLSMQYHDDPIPQTEKLSKDGESAVENVSRVKQRDSESVIPGRETWTELDPALVPAGSNKPNELKNLRRSIHDSLTESAFDLQPFFPQSRFDLVDRHTIEVALAATGDELGTIEFADLIQHELKRFFIILVFIRADVGKALATLRRFGVTDRFLPISKEAIEDNCEERDSARDCEHAAELNAFHYEPWDYETLSTFYDQQWKFLAPVFTTQDRELHLPARTILPFVDVGKHRISGPFSDVYRTKIHEDHIQNSKFLDPTKYVAVKELRVDADLPRALDSLKTDEFETQALMRLNDVQHEHLVLAIAAIKRGERQYFLQPWADGGDLREFWVENDIRPLTDYLIFEALTQLVGLSDALSRLHELNCRHGDVKPENVLRFKDEKTTIGILKLADLGLTKHHRQETALRREATKTLTGTIRYEPPETVTASNTPRSRLYDTWSMGCLILEFVIWLLHGPDGLRELNKDLNADSPGAFYSLNRTSSSDNQADVSKAAKMWIDHICDDDSFADSAIHDLVRLVKDRLLVVAVSSPLSSTAPSSEVDSNLDLYPQKSLLQLKLRSATTSDQLFATSEVTVQSATLSQLPTNVRADARELRDALKRICQKANADNTYLFPSTARSLQARRQAPRLSLPVPRDLLRPPSPPQILKPFLNIGVLEYRTPEFIDTWGYIVDNSFAADFLRSLPDESVPRQTKAPNLCERCEALNISDEKLVVTYSVANLEERAQHCELCALFYSAALGSGVPMHTDVEFRRHLSTLNIRGGGPPALSLVAGPDFSKSPHNIQIGFPILPEPTSTTSYQLMKYWLQICDADHNCISASSSNVLPKRLLAVHDEMSLKVRLCDTAGMDLVPYIALSFYRGQSTSPGIWRTDLAHLSEFQHEIDVQQLCSTYQDAIAVTRALGISFLWIDMMCIVQDGTHDLLEELSNVGNIFGNAYCTIAVPDTTESFLVPRRERAFVPLGTTSDGCPITICEMIDDFQKHVDGSPLSSRGWAFQERVLSRRTIFFTSSQTYWQCGRGIRCETMTKLSNLTADLLGDPDFPSLMKEKLSPLRTYELLYERYSRLNFTRDTDRPLAIEALEKKLLLAFGTTGGHGILLKYLQRSLLWRRGSDETLRCIEFLPGQRKPPSWSWMAYTGAINYLDVPFGGIDWHQLWMNFNPPSLMALAREYLKERVSYLIYDLPNQEERSGQKCVIVGTTRVDQSTPAKPRAYYLLLVAPREDSKAWERVGIGFAEGARMFLDESAEEIQIW